MSGGSLLWALPGVIVAGLLLLSSVRARRELRSMPVVVEEELVEPLTVIMPARNEGTRIGPTLDALLKDPSPQLRVFVYDDRSTDDTAACVAIRVARDPRLALLHGVDEPSDGFGKPIALQRATDLANPSGWVLFLDADVHVASGFCGGLVAAARREGADAVSGSPSLSCVNRVEAALVPTLVSLVAARYPPSHVRDRTRPEAFLNGQVILLARSTLDAVGGWHAVRSTVLEDVELAGLLKRSGRALGLFDLRDVSSTRMYTSYREIRDGFGKNAVPLFGGTAACALTGILAATIGVVPWLAVVVAAGFGGASAVLAAVLALGLVLAAQTGLRRAGRMPLWPVFIGPFVYLVVARILVGAAWRHRRGLGVSWRGRTYAVGGPKSSG